MPAVPLCRGGLDRAKEQTRNCHIIPYLLCLWCVIYHSFISLALHIQGYAVEARPGGTNVGVSFGRAPRGSFLGGCQESPCSLRSVLPRLLRDAHRVFRPIPHRFT